MSWGHSNVVGVIYTPDSKRFGNGPNPVEKGDLLLCVEHTGDHFYDYIVVREVEGRVRGFPDKRIGSYSFSDGLAYALDDRDYHLLAAGESIPLSKIATSIIRLPLPR